MKYFTVKDLVYSAQADKLTIDNTPPIQIKVKLCSLINNLLDPIRELWGTPFTVFNGFLSPVLNKSIGGNLNSQHSKGEAVHITTACRSLNKELFDMIAAMEIEFDQLIEKNNYEYIHLSLSTKNRHEISHLK